MTEQQTGAPTYFTDKHAVSMTLRDYFAAKAMQAFIRNQVGTSEWVGDEKIAEYAYELADAMLEARSKE